MHRLDPPPQAARQDAAINTPVSPGSQTSIEESVRKDIVLRDIVATARADMRFGRYFALKLAPQQDLFTRGRGSIFPVVPRRCAGPADEGVRKRTDIAITQQPGDLVDGESPLAEVSLGKSLS